MNKLFVSMAVVGISCTVSAAAIEQVIVRQQWPWSTDVKVEYKLSGVKNMFTARVPIYGRLRFRDTTNFDTEKGINVGVVNMRFAKPLDEELLLADAAKTHRLVTMEEGVVKGGVGEAIMETLNDHGLLQTTAVLPFGIPDEFISQGDKKLLMRDIGLAPEQMAERIAQWIK